MREVLADPAVRRRFAEFGLDADALRERFAGYVARYDIPLESFG